jgi:2-phospho-L-lactate guanylyltransferase (CobY/MobA/RfbA family)
VLLLSSDLPRVTEAAVREMLHAAARFQSPVAVAAAASGRGGTNALYLRPPQAIGLHFGDESLAQFRADAEQRGVKFAVFESEALALDLDEPADLARVKAV